MTTYPFDTATFRAVCLPIAALTFILLEEKNVEFVDVSGKTRKSTSLSSSLPLFATDGLTKIKPSRSSPLDGNAWGIILEFDDPKRAKYKDIKQTLLKRFGSSDLVQIHEKRCLMSSW